MAYRSIMSSRLSVFIFELLVITDLLSVFGTTELLPQSDSQFSGQWDSNDGVHQVVWAKRGSSVTLKCPISSKYPLETTSVRWVWRRNNDVNERRYVVSPQGDLNITKVSGKKSGEYRCIIPTIHGNISGPPTFLYIASLKGNAIISTNSSTVREGESLRIVCQIESEPSANITWFFNRQPLPQSDRYIQLDSGVLQIHSVTNDDAGAYRCTCTNPILNRQDNSDDLEITVEAPPPSGSPPVFLSPNVTRQVVQGQGVTLECLVSGTPRPSVAWYYTTMNNNESRLVEHGRLNGDNLVLTAVQASEEGTYMCVATSVNPTNNQNIKITQETKLTIIKQPMIDIPPTEQEVLLGKAARLHCTVSTKTVNWYKNGLKIYNDSVSWTRDYRFQDYQLVVLDIRETAIFQCMYSNDAGYVSGWAKVSVIHKENQPHPPRNLRYTPLSPSSGILRWDNVECNQCENRGVVYSIKYRGVDMPEWTDEVVAENDIELNEMKPNTDYIFKVRAYTTTPSNYSKEYVYKTPEDVPRISPNFSLTTTSFSTLVVTWESLSPNDARGIITKYEIHYELIPPENSATNFNHPASYLEVGPHETSKEITGLLPGKKYTFRVVPSTSKGHPEIVETKEIRMPKFGVGPTPIVPNLPSAPLLNVSAIPSNSSNNALIKVHWKTSSNNTAKIMTYQLRYKKHQDEKWAQTINFRNDKSSFIITGLENDWYSVELRGLDKNNRFGNPSLKIIHTGTGIMYTDENMYADDLPKVINLKVKYNDTSAHLSWELDYSGSSEISFYTVYYKGPDASLSYPTQTTEKTQVTVDHLSPSTVYEFMVRAHLSDNYYGKYCRPVNISTLAISETTHQGNVPINRLNRQIPDMIKAVFPDAVFTDKTEVPINHMLVDLMKNDHHQIQVPPFLMVSKDKELQDKMPFIEHIEIHSDLIKVDERNNFKITKLLDKINSMRKHFNYLLANAQFCFDNYNEPKDNSEFFIGTFLSSLKFFMNLIEEEIITLRKLCGTRIPHKIRDELIHAPIKGNHIWNIDSIQSKILRNYLTRFRPRRQILRGCSRRRGFHGCSSFKSRKLSSKGTSNNAKEFNTNERCSKINAHKRTRHKSAIKL